MFKLCIFLKYFLLNIVNSYLKNENSINSKILKYSKKLDYQITTIQMKFYVLKAIRMNSTNVVGI